MHLIKVLLVDDESDLLDILKVDIESLGYETLTASNGQEALDIMKKVKEGTLWVDAVLSDINMPVMNGLLFLKELRNLGLDIPFVFFSGYGDKEKTIEALRLGALDFLEKPYDPDVLLATMKKAAELGSMMKEIEAELNDLVKNSGIAEAEVEKFKKAQREMLKIKKMNEIYVKR
ncbi:MAG: response regulator [Bdellovibrionaceae bacterium]|nr:response regulator [Pseudobdellovibrionaceae bacterium]NUM58937.1 response regulator [Pseudobdellovibrionaceae bacterium]